MKQEKKGKQQFGAKIYTARDTVAVHKSVGKSLMSCSRLGRLTVDVAVRVAQSRVTQIRQVLNASRVFASRDPLNLFTPSLTTLTWPSFSSPSHHRLTARYVVSSLAQRSLNQEFSHDHAPFIPSAPTAAAHQQSHTAPWRWATVNAPRRETVERGGCSAVILTNVFSVISGQ